MGASKNEIINNVSEICEIVDKLDVNINKIDRKISDITRLFYKLSYNSSLQSGDTNSYLKFQIDQLKNEKKYFSNIKKDIKEKFVSDIYIIAESILMLLSSIETIKIDQEEEKNNILKKINSLKNYKSKMETSSILELINSTIHNLELIKEFVIIFEKYIKETTEKNMRENYHFNNFKTNLENKKDHIMLEYNKYYHKLNELIDYFVKYTCELDEQLKHQKILDFFVNKNYD